MVLLDEALATVHDVDARSCWFGCVAATLHVVPGVVLHWSWHHYLNNSRYNVLIIGNVHDNFLDSSLAWQTEAVAQINKHVGIKCIYIVVGGWIGQLVVGSHV